MIEIKIPKEIKHYKEKLAFGLTVRQLISVILALTINIPLYFWGKEFINKDVIEWIVILVSMPLVMIGWFNYNGMNFEEFIIAIIQSEFIYPKKRIYKSENIYENLLDFDLKLKKEKEKELKKNRPKEKKEIKKRKEKRTKEKRTKEKYNFFNILKDKLKAKKRKAKKIETIETYEGTHEEDKEKYLENKNEIKAKIAQIEKYQKERQELKNKESAKNNINDGEDSDHTPVFEKYKSQGIKDQAETKIKTQADKNIQNQVANKRKEEVIKKDQETLKQKKEKKDESKNINIRTLKKKPTRRRRNSEFQRRKTQDKYHKRRN